MKILQINKFHYPQGGADVHYLKLLELLEKKGHTVMHFSMRHSKNLPSSYSSYFVSNMAIDKVRYNPFKALKIIGKFIYNFEAAKKLKKLIQKEKPDIAHIHNIYHQLSPSILVTLKRYKIPVVMTVHDYKLICPNYTMYVRGKECLHAFKNKYYQCVFHKCIKNSYIASMICAIEAYVHSLFGWYRNNIDIAIAPSRFMRDKLVHWGAGLKKIIVVPNFVDCAEWKSEKIRAKDQIFLFVGRLSKEKGVDFLLQAWKKRKNKESKLVIIGDGPEKSNLMRLKNDLQCDNAEFIGSVPAEKIKFYLKQAAAVIVPSQYNDNFPQVILESFAAGVPAIGTNMGGIPELIKHHERGMIFDHKNINSLASSIDYVIEHKDQAMRWGKNCSQYAENDLSFEKYYNTLMSIYGSLIRVTNKNI